MPTNLISVLFLELFFPVTAEAEEVPIPAPLVARTCPWESRRGLQGVSSSVPAGPWFVAWLSPAASLQTKAQTKDSWGGLFYGLLPRSKTDKAEPGLVLSHLLDTLN